MRTHRESVNRYYTLLGDAPRLFEWREWATSKFGDFRKNFVMTFACRMSKKLFGHLVDGDRLSLLFRRTVRIPVLGDIAGDLVAGFLVLPEFVGFGEA